jgi:hypothetical protein
MCPPLPLNLMQKGPKRFSIHPFVINKPYTIDLLISKLNLFQNMAESKQKIMVACSILLRGPSNGRFYYCPWIVKNVFYLFAKFGALNPQVNIGFGNNHSSGTDFQFFYSNNFPSLGF